jgi:Na+/proline symporter
MRSLTEVDFIVMVAYILGIVFIGSMFARRQKTASDFFLANR